MHVHCRGFSEYEKATISSVMSLARSQGVVAIGDMANNYLSLDFLARALNLKSSPRLSNVETNPEYLEMALIAKALKHFSRKETIRLVSQIEKEEKLGKRGGSIISRELVKLRLLTAEYSGCSDGYHLHVGATKGERQLVEAAEIATENNKVIGIKVVYGTTTGALSITEEADLRNIFIILTRIGYKGLVVVHCEKESLGNFDLFVPEHPDTWNLAKPPIMGIEAVKDVIRYAGEAGFGGHIHIAHTSTPQEVDLVYEAKIGGMRISCGVTPHHLTLSTRDMQTPEGVKHKVNPPLREYEMMMGLRAQLMSDKIIESKLMTIETDHAPHTPYGKTYHPDKPKNAYMSGIPSLEVYSAFISALRDWGLSEYRIFELTNENIKNVYPKLRTSLRE